ncbi:MAG: Undecaprenyl-phosphate glucose phosphotransferase [Saprospiraceae bacterium]|jgi:Undecaprenyl-phosphate glucose phosphotransferase
MIRKKQHLVFSNIIIEFLLLNLSIFSVFFFKNIFSTIPIDAQNVPAALLSFAGLFNLIWALVILINRDQDFYISTGNKKKIKSFVLSIFMFIGIISTIAITFKIEYFNRTTFMLPIFLFSIMNIISLGIVSDIYKRKKSSDFVSRVLLIGSAKKWKNIQATIQYFQERDYGVVGFLDHNSSKSKLEGVSILGRTADLKEVLDAHLIDEIFIMGGILEEKEIKEIIRVADYKGRRVNIIPETPVLPGNTLKPYTMDGVTLFQHRQTPLDNFSNYFLKRVFDVFFSLTVLIVLGPLFLMLGLIIFLDSKGPIFYTPLRKGESGNVFKCYKFRTMSTCDDPANGTKSTVKNDPRITRIGKYLRKFDLDELPQFFNVLKGNMSVVGPRPHRVNLDQDFRKVVNDYMVRHYVKPGITGWAQVNGWRGPTNTNEQKKKRVWYDLWYIENWEFILDIKIIFLTVFSKKTRINAF